MSAWVVEFRRDGKPSPGLCDGRGSGPGPIDGVMDSLAHHGIDASQTRDFPAITLGQQWTWSTEEEAGEREILTHAGAGIFLLWDGRLENRDTLVRDLGTAGVSDGALALEALARWGDEGVARLDGPFALALWNPRLQSLLCARDVLGRRGLFFVRTQSLFLAATEEAALLAHPEVSRDEDPESTARFFGLEGPRSGATFYAGMGEVQPGECLVVGRESCRSFSLPPLDPSTELRLKSDAEYAEAFLECMRESVMSASRCRSGQRVAVLMSGGLDSTTVASLAAQVTATARPPLAVSWIFDQLPTCDEREWIAPVVKRAGLEAVEVPADGLGPLAGGLADWPSTPNGPLVGPYRLLMDRGYRAASARGAGPVLTGWFGDDLYFGSTQFLASLIRGGRIGQLIREGRFAAGSAVGGREFTLAWRYWLASELGLRRLRRLWRADDRKAPWLAQDAWQAAFAHESDKILRGRALRLKDMTHSLGMRGAIDDRRFAALAGVDARHPLRSRSVVQFALSLPADQLYGQGLEKKILRSATRGLLPDRVRERTEARPLGALFDRYVLDVRREEALSMLGPDSLWWRFLEPTRIRGLVEGLKNGSLTGAESLLVWMGISGEIWNRRVLQGGRV